MSNLEHIIPGSGTPGDEGDTGTQAADKINASFDKINNRDTTVTEGSDELVTSGAVFEHTKDLPDLVDEAKELRDEALTARNQAEGFRNDAQTAETNANQSATAAGISQTEAIAARNQAVFAQGEAEAAAGAALGLKNDAEAARDAAETFKDAAEAAAQASPTIEQQVATWARNDAFDVVGADTITEQGVTLPENITWPNGVSGSLSNLVVTDGNITSLRYNYDGTTQYVTADIDYSGEFPTRVITPTGF